MARPWLFRVDFNDVGGRNGRMIKVLAPDSVAGPERGDRALLVDLEQNRCLATVSAVKDGVVALRIDPETWTEPSRDVLRPKLAKKRRVAVSSISRHAYGETRQPITARELVKG